MAKLIPDDLKLEGIDAKGAKYIAGNPNAFCDYINHLVEAYNDIVDDVNEYYRLLVEKELELVEFKLEHKIMARIIHDHGLWETFLNDDEFLEHLRGDNNAIDNEE